MAQTSGLVVRVADSEQRVLVELAGAHATVHVDGQELEVELHDQHAVVRTPQGPVRVELSPERAPRTAVLHGVAWPVHTQSDAEAALEATLNTSRSSAGGNVVSAPMPGRVVKLLVAVGDDVPANTPVVVVEAMKMENELRAPISGRVAAIEVEQGATVDAGQVLLRLDPAEAE